MAKSYLSLYARALAAARTPARHRDLEPARKPAGELTGASRIV
jgi:hypothetical protein